MLRRACTDCGVQLLSCSALPHHGASPAWRRKVHSGMKVMRQHPSLRELTRAALAGVPPEDFALPAAAAGAAATRAPARALA